MTDSGIDFMIIAGRVGLTFGVFGCFLILLCYLQQIRRDSLPERLSPVSIGFLGGAYASLILVFVAAVWVVWS